MSRAGWTAGPIVVVLVVLGGIAIAVITISGNLANPGGQPHSIHLGPPSLVLYEGVPATVSVGLVLTSPLPTPVGTLTWDVDIDEDDETYDDDLVDKVTVSFRTGAAYATGSFQLVCRNLGPTGDFDLEAFPTVVDVSTGEAVHYVHAEGPGDNSANIQVTCTG